MTKLGKRIRYFLKMTKPRPFSHERELERRLKRSKERDFLLSTPR